MKSRILVCALAAASLSFSSLSFAQGHDRGDRGDRDRQGAQQRDGDRRDGDRRGGDRRGQRGDNDWSQRSNDRGQARHYGRDDRRSEMGQRGGYRAEQYYYGARGPEWRRGGHIPHHYRSHQYVVNDWRGHRLHAPPHGYHWVQVGGDYVLVAIATGIIAQLLLNQ
jgi:Ni/Co efflux regulator RcnB